MPTSATVVQQVYLETEGVRGLDWQEQAACRGSDVEGFFADGRVNSHVVAVCAACPALEACRQYAIERDWIYGIWGGTTKAERDRVRRRRAAGLPDDPADERRCRNGHLLNEANAYRRGDGGLRCRRCVRDRWHARKAVAA